MIKTIIVEDDPKHLAHLEKLVSENFPEIKVLASCKSVPNAIDKVRELKPDLIFLDIELPPHNGFELLEQTKDQNYKVIFTTAFDNYATQAFDFCALHYLIKTFDETDLKSALDRYKQALSQENYRERLDSFINNLRQSEINLLEIYVTDKGSQRKVRLEQIICISTGGGKNRLRIVNEPEDITTTKTLNWFEDRLKRFNFYRIHDNCIVNLIHVNEIIHDNEVADLILSDGKKAGIAKRKKAGFMEVINNRNILGLTH